MTRVVYNACFGGFGVSEAAARRMAELGSEPMIKELANHADRVAAFERGDLGYDGEPLKAYTAEWYGGARDVERDDPILIQVIEELGPAANGDHALLEIVDIPDDVKWEIAEYDGSEHVAEQHRTWR